MKGCGFHALGVGIQRKWKVSDGRLLIIGELEAGMAHKAAVLVNGASLFLR
jgi:hypothetical protein